MLTLKIIQIQISHSSALFEKYSQSIKRNNNIKLHPNLTVVIFCPMGKVVPDISEECNGFMQLYDFKQKMTEQQNRTHITQHTYSTTKSFTSSVAECGTMWCHMWCYPKFPRIRIYAQTISAMNLCC